MDRLIEKLPENNDKYFIKHREGTNSFRIRQDKNQQDKEYLFNLIYNKDKKHTPALRKKKVAIVDPRRIKNFAILKLKELDEKYKVEWE